MPFKKVWESHGVVATWYGDVIDEELLRYAQSVHASPEFDTLRYSLLDFRNCTGITFSHDNMEYIAALDEVAFSRVKNIFEIKVAVVTQRDDVISMVKEFVSENLSPCNFQIFSNIEHANLWLERCGFID